MESGLGQKYGFQINNVAISANPSAVLDLLTITAQTNIPIAIERIVLYAPVNQAQAVPLFIAVRSTAGSGGSTSAVSATAEPPSGSNATEVFAYNVTTVGTVVKTSGAGSWQLFGTYLFTRKPGGLLITPGQTFAIAAPANAIATGGFSMSVEGEYTAFK